jgi:intein/homing endonuclease
MKISKKKASESLIKGLKEIFDYGFGNESTILYTRTLVDLFVNGDYKTLLYSVGQIPSLKQQDRERFFRRIEAKKNAAKGYSGQKSIMEMTEEEIMSLID